MKQLTVDSERQAYEVVAGAGAVNRLSEILAAAEIDRPSSVISDTTVSPLWGSSAARSLGAPMIELADGEEHKRWSTVETLLGQWLDEGLHRGDTVAAVGGGVLTDTVGFAAAVYLRGIDWIAVPTTLLAMVDAIRLIEKSGLNAEKVLPAVGGGAAGSWQFSNLGPRVLQHDFDPGFMIKLLVKDLKIAQNLLESLDLKMPVTEENIKLFIDAHAKGYGDLGTQGIYNYFADQQDQEHLVKC